MELKVTGEMKLLAFLSEFVRRLNEGEDYEITVRDVARKIDQMYRMKGKELDDRMNDLEKRIKNLNKKYRKLINLK